MTYQSIDTRLLGPVGASPAAALLRRGAGIALRRYGVLAGFLAVWQAGSTLGWINPTVFPPLDKILAATWAGVAGGALLDEPTEEGWRCLALVVPREVTHAV